MQKVLKSVILSILALLMAPTLAAEADKAKDDYFAVVGDQVIPVSEYIIQLRVNSRQRFFHGKAPDEEIAKFKKEIAEKVVNRALMLQEAKRRKIKPDARDVKARLDNIVKRRESNPEWAKRKDELIPKITRELEEESLIEVLEKKIRDIPEPADKQVRAFYKKNPDIFTAPEQIRVALIMLKVDPSSPSEVWQAAQKEAGGLVKKLRSGSDFAEMARIHSGDETAAKGGDMGYIHKGMLARPAQQVLDMMDPGDISEPVMLLQGVAIFRLDDRTTPKLNPYDKVRERAAALARRELSEKTWVEFLSGLRKNTKIKINEELLKVDSEQKQGKS